MSDRLLARFYTGVPHPYRLFELEVDGLVARGAKVLMDAGCGRTVPVLRKYLGRVDRLIGVELVDFTDVPPGITGLWQVNDRYSVSAHEMLELDRDYAANRTLRLDLEIKVSASPDERLGLLMAVHCLS